MRYKIILSLIYLTTIVYNAKADEGMWLINNLSTRTDSIMHSLGLELNHEELYSTNKPCLNNAIVNFGGFCSGVVVSNEGLVFTNHHCGYSSIHEHTTKEHNYLKYGFFAKDYSEELPNEGLYVQFHLSTIDVTDKILSQVNDSMDLNTRNEIINEAISSIERLVLNEKKGIFGNVTPYYKGSKYYLSIYQRYNDVRLVFAPPETLGKYGGDSDNWEWPRQTCDFSVFRIYANNNNQPADYNKNNRPLHPKSYAHVSIKGYQPGTFCMTMGYPGHTDRYLSSYGIKSTMTTTNDIRYNVIKAKLDILDKAMKANEDINIKYSDKYFVSSNYMKYSLGQNQALENLKVLEEKEQFEKDIKEWIAKNNKTQYEGILDSLKVQYEKYFENKHTLRLIEESFFSGSDILSFVLEGLIDKNFENKKSLKNRINDSFRDIDIELDKQVFAAMAKKYLEMCKSLENRPDFFDEIDSIYGGDIDAFTDNLYSKSKLCDRAKLSKIKKEKNIINDPICDIAASILLCTLKNLYNSEQIENNERLLGEALREMYHDKDFYPDANFTQRISFGTIKPFNGMFNTYPESLIDKNKNNPNNLDYDLLPEVYSWIMSKDFGEQYLDKNHNLPLCFLTNNDITGGNSGSGMFNGKGHLIGLAFDGNWEAMSSDLNFDNQYQRCIGVDIRYVLSVIEHYGKAERIIKELTIEN